MSSGAPRGDSHNFGRRVEIREERVTKPRTLLWEQLLLSAHSPLRRRLNELSAESALGATAFEFLPNLRFWKANAPAGGQVERLQLEPLVARSGEKKRELASVLGRAIALFSWLGLTDLHWENLALGSAPQGRIVFGPLDVEMVLSDFRLPTETKLLPDADPEYAELCRHAAGVRRALAFLGKPLAAQELLHVVAQYRATLELLDRNGAALAEVLAGLPDLHHAPIRVLLRSTGDYVNANDQQPWPPLLEAEAEQLARGDVPYFFRLYGAPGIHYYGSRNLEQIRTLPSGRGMPKNPPLLDVKRGLRSPSRKRLREDGLFTLIGAFDAESLTGRHEGEHAAAGWLLELTKRRVRLQLPSGEELETDRDLRAFVGSAYLRCSCGEVKSALVPPVTVCRPARASV
ncbi:MAG TPA: hypothetical protein VHB79_20175 [Polyangiaceae bacterium]|nr:hypothetical protein [Polyangiaceae bacterium]